ncbi:MAG: anti-sigma factor [Pirellulales bacterium]|nr:anti-sigma factor [Pirellulales bacterium]
MTTDDLSKRERLEELLALSSAEGLCLPQREELDALLLEYPSVSEDLFEHAVAALDVSFAVAQPERQLPEALLEDLARQGEAIVASQSSSSSQSDHGQRETPQPASTAVPVAKSDVIATAPATEGLEPTSATATRASRTVRGTESRSLWSSVTALAACVMLAMFLTWVFWPQEQVVPELTLAQQLQQLESDAGTVHIDWNETDGEVVWNQQRQEGFMRFRNLPINDPKVEQYQLWIFDGLRNAAHPVDGGVFDMSAPQQDADSVIVRIQAKLHVNEPGLFAVTVEKPGGVVVSERAQIVATASMDSAKRP